MGDFNFNGLLVLFVQVDPPNQLSQPAVSSHLWLNTYLTNMPIAQNASKIRLICLSQMMFVTNVKALETKLSDNNMVDIMIRTNWVVANHDIIMISYNPVSPDHTPCIPSFDENTFRFLDFNKTMLS